MEMLWVVLVGGGIIALLGLVLFFIGKYNFLITLRQKIAGDTRDLDLLLRVEIERLQCLRKEREKVRSGEEKTDDLSRAEALAHEANARKLDSKTITLLREVFSIVTEEYTVSPENSSQAPIITTSGSPELIPEKLEMLTKLSVEYDRSLSGFAGRFIGIVSGFSKLRG